MADQPFQVADDRAVMWFRAAQRSLSTSLPGNDEALRVRVLGPDQQNLSCLGRWPLELGKPEHRQACLIAAS
jgi:hypothetical protein